MRRTQAATGAIVANVIFALLMVRGNPTEPDPPEVVADIGGAVHETLLETAADSNAPPCERTYIGVGFQYLYTGSSLLVTRAPEQLPAYRMGLRVGDEVVSISMDTSKPGQEAVIRVRRGGHIVALTTKTDTICFEAGV